jgi:O-antigen/teichoic acid export membrane protein
MKTARPTFFLFAIDSIANQADYLFHIYLGRALSPGDFAAVQTIHAALLILVTAFGVTQPVAARFVVEAVGRRGSRAAAQTANAEDGRGVFQVFFRYSLWAGALLSLFTWLGRGWLAGWLNAPVFAVALVSIMPLLALLRPLVAGMLQGQQRFAPFGFTRAGFAAARLLIGALLVSAGWGARGAIAAFPISALLSLVVGLAFLGASVWRKSPMPPAQVIGKGLSLSAAAFVAYAAFMGLQSNDLIWVNRAFAAELAAAYAAAVLLRRILALLPFAITTILYPQMVAQAARGRLPDRLLLQAALATAAAILFFTLLYSVFGPWIISFTFGAASTQYTETAPLLGWMGMAMLGYSLASIWLNLYLATRPAPFVALLLLALAGQFVLFAVHSSSLLQVSIDFAVSGWAAAVAGLLLYLFWLRPQFENRCVS